MSFILPVCIKSGEKCWSGKAGDPQTRAENGRTGGKRHWGGVEGRSAGLRGDHGNKGLGLMREQTCSQNMSSFILYQSTWLLAGLRQLSSLLCFLPLGSKCRFWQDHSRRLLRKQVTKCTALSHSLARFLFLDILFHLFKISITMNTGSEEVPQGIWSNATGKSRCLYLYSLVCWHDLKQSCTAVSGNGRSIPY